MRRFTFEQDLDGNNFASKFSTLDTSFGDGYMQTISVGINNRRSTYAYQLTERKAEIDKVKAFFDEHKGAKAFIYPSLTDGDVKVRAKDYSISKVGFDVYRISTTFEQVF